MERKVARTTFNPGNVSITMQDFVDPLKLQGRDESRKIRSENPVSFPSSKIRVLNNDQDESPLMHTNKIESYFVSCITNNQHPFHRSRLEEEQLHKFYRESDLGSRSTGFIQDRFNVDPVAWGQQGQGQAYPGFGSLLNTSTQPVDHLLPISLATPTDRKAKSSKCNVRAEVNEIPFDEASKQFLSTYNHDYWPRPVISPLGKQEVFLGKSFGGYSKPNLFCLGDDWNWKWIPSQLDSSAMHLLHPSDSQRLEGENSEAPGWAKILNSDRICRFNPYDRSEGPIEPMHHNPFPILMARHTTMLNKNILNDINPEVGQRKNFT